MFLQLNCLLPFEFFLKVRNFFRNYVSPIFESICNCVNLKVDYGLNLFNKVTIRFVVQTSVSINEVLQIE